MENHEQTSFRFEIDNFSEKEAMYVISSPIFESGGREWFVRVYPKGCPIGRHDHLSVYLFVLKPESLRSGWKLRADCRFILLNQSGKELKRTSAICFMFSAESIAWGYPQLVPMTKLQEESFLENNKLIIEVQIKVGEIVDEPGKIHSLTRLFADHPGIAVDFRPKNPLVKTAYMNVLLGLIETLKRPPQSLSETELRNAHSELSKLTEAGFKLDWLETKLEEVSLDRKNTIFDCSQVEEHVKNLKLELDNEKAKSSTASAKVLLLEKAVSDLKLELEKERSAKSAISKVASLKDAAVCFWNTAILGISPLPANCGESFQWDEILAGTVNFRQKYCLGQGNFGKVYRCILGRTNQVGAAKIQSLGDPASHLEFLAEVTTLHAASHPNVIRLLGQCYRRRNRVIIYEYMPNGSLERHLFAQERQNQGPQGHLLLPTRDLDWETRMRIAVGVAEGLLYLHQELRVIKLDVKAGNILLDENFVPKLTDFRLATKIVTDENGIEQEITISPLKGTRGCIAPEAEELGLVSTKSDVYSYGVFLLVLFTGMKPYDSQKPDGEKKLTDLLMPIWDRLDYPYLLNPSMVMDVKLRNKFSVEGFNRIIQTAGMCIRAQRLERPDMSVVVTMVREAADCLSLIETLKRPPQSLSETELRNAHSELIELTEAGFKLDWLETKLEEVSLERKNTIFDCSQVEEHVENLKLELDNEKAKSSTASAKVLLLEKAVSDLKLELEKERSAKSDISKVSSLKDAAVCFWDTKILGIRQRRAGYLKLD